MVHTVDVLSRAYIRSSLAVLVVVPVELALVGSIHQPVQASLRLRVKSTLLLRRRAVMVVVEELSHMYMLDLGHGIGRCMGSIPMRTP